MWYRIYIIMITAGCFIAFGCSPSGGGRDKGSSSSSLTHQGSDINLGKGDPDDPNGAKGENIDNNDDNGAGNNGGNTDGVGPMNDGPGSPGHSQEDPNANSTDPTKQIGGPSIIISPPTTGGLPNVAPNSPFWNDDGSGDEGNNSTNPNDKNSGIHIEDLPGLINGSDQPVYQNSHLIENSHKRKEAYKLAPMTLSVCAFTNSYTVSYGGLNLSLYFQNIPDILFSLWKQMGYGDDTWANVPVGIVVNVTQTENVYDQGWKLETFESTRPFKPFASSTVIYFGKAWGANVGTGYIGSGETGFSLMPSLRTIAAGLEDPNTSVPDNGMSAFFQTVITDINPNDSFDMQRARGPLPTLNINISFPIVIMGIKIASYLIKFKDITPGVIDGSTNPTQSQMCFQGINENDFSSNKSVDVSTSPFWKQMTLPVR